MHVHACWSMHYVLLMLRLGLQDPQAMGVSSSFLKWVGEEMAPKPVAEEPAQEPAAPCQEEGEEEAPEVDPEVDPEGGPEEDPEMPVEEAP